MTIMHLPLLPIAHAAVLLLPLVYASTSAQIVRGVRGRPASTVSLMLQIPWQGVWANFSEYSQFIVSTVPTSNSNGRAMMNIMSRHGVYSSGLNCAAAFFLSLTASAVGFSSGCSKKSLRNHAYTAHRSQQGSNCCRQWESTLW